MPITSIPALAAAIALATASVETTPPPKPPEKFIAQLLTIAPGVGLLTVAGLTQNPWPAVLVPASMGLGHVYVGEPLRAAGVTVAGPIATYGGAALGYVIGYGLARIFAPDDFIPDTFGDPPVVSIFIMGACSIGGGLLGLTTVGKWTFEDASRIADERNKPLGPFRLPGETP